MTIGKQDTEGFVHVISLFAAMQDNIITVCTVLPILYYPTAFLLTFPVRLVTRVKQTFLPSPTSAFKADFYSVNQPRVICRKQNKACRPVTASLSSCTGMWKGTQAGSDLGHCFMRSWHSHRYPMHSFPHRLR